VKLPCGTGKPTLTYPRPSWRYVGGALPGPSHPLGGRQPGGARDRTDASGPPATVTGECGAGHRADNGGGGDRSPPLPRCLWATHCHPRKLPGRQASSTWRCRWIIGLTALRQALETRFCPDHEIFAKRGAEHGLAALAQLRTQGCDVAVVIGSKPTHLPFEPSRNRVIGKPEERLGDSLVPPTSPRLTAPRPTRDLRSP
jgi:hypothetical protein